MWSPRYEEASEGLRPTVTVKSERSVGCWPYLGEAEGEGKGGGESGGERGVGGMLAVLWVQSLADELVRRVWVGEGCGRYLECSVWNMSSSEESSPMHITKSSVAASPWASRASAELARSTKRCVIAPLLMPLGHT